MELIESLKAVLIETAQTLTGATRRLFMARTVKMLGRGGAQCAEKELSWNRGTIRKGQHELQSGFMCVDNFSARGRKRAEEHWPKLEQDIREIVGPQSQIDPSFKTERLYTWLSVEQGIITAMPRTLPTDLKVDRSAFSVSSLTAVSDEKAYWLARTPEERLKQVEILRRINYGSAATARLQRVLEIIEREKR